MNCRGAAESQAKIRKLIPDSAAIGAGARQPFGSYSKDLTLVRQDLPACAIGYKIS